MQNTHLQRCGAVFPGGEKGWEKKKNSLSDEPKRSRLLSHLKPNKKKKCFLRRVCARLPSRLPWEV